MLRFGSVLHYHHGTLAILLPCPAIPISLVLFRVGFALLPRYLVDLGFYSKIASTTGPDHGDPGDLVIFLYFFRVPWRS